MYMKSFGLIGKDISHSFSGEFFNGKFKAEGISSVYSLFNLNRIDEFPDLLKKHPDLRGLNVTSPYKREIIRFLDELSPDAEKLNAVNVINFNVSLSGETKLVGHNTDCEGFRMTIHNIVPDHTKALILGTGGASSAVAHALFKENIPYLIMSRIPEASQVGYDMINELLPDYKLVINATPVGMYPNVSNCPIEDFSKVGKGHIFYDLIYNPAETIFLKNAKSRGATIVNGMQMLINQAQLSWEIWNKG